MNLISFTLGLSLLLCALVAGLLLAFCIVVMPGIQCLNDNDYLKAFKVMDGVIQNNQPIFMLIWLGSTTALIVSTLIGFRQLSGLDQLLLATACSAYLIGVQLPTVKINIPLNNGIQTLNLEEMSRTDFQDARKIFEPTWTRWNTFRTVIATFTTAILIVLVIRL